VVDRLRQIGVQPWFNLGYGNRLYTPEAPDASAVGWAPLWSDEARQAWLRFTRALAEHFRDRVKHWEIWNEPNIKGFWKPRTPDAADYVELVRLTAPVIGQVVPGAVIVGGALAGMPLDYLKKCLEHGLGQLVEKISYHPYRPVPEAKYDAEVAAFRDVLTRHNPKAALWQGENGCPSQPGGAGALKDNAWTERRQAKWLVRRILSDLRLRIELTSYFHLVDLVNYNWGKGGSGQTNFKGLLRGTDYTPKPAFFAYQCLGALFDAQTRRADLPLELSAPAGAAPLDQQALRTAGFVRGGRPLYAYWWPAGTDEERDVRPSTLKLPDPPEGRLDAPVLIDPLTAKVHGLAGAVRSGAAWQIEQAPLADYPLLVTEKSLLPLSEPEGTQESRAAVGPARPAKWRDRWEGKRT
jgi:hypothetical protein